jgi:nucleotide-binding universal stress UspA family protein
MVVRNVVVPIDFSAVSEAALAYGRNFARAFGARLHVIHVAENDFLRPTAADPHVLSAALDRQVANKLTQDDRQSLNAVAVIRKSDAPADEIVQYAKGENADIIIMGTHGRRGIAHVLVGSVAEKVIRSAPCPVLTVRHPDLVSGATSPGPTVPVLA